MHTPHVKHDKTSHAKTSHVNHAKTSHAHKSHVINHMLIMLLNMEEFLNVLIVAGMVI